MIVEAFHALAAVSSTPQLLLAADGQIRGVNQAALRLLGRTRGEVEGSSLDRWLDPAGPELDSLLKRYLQTGSSLPGALALLGRDGEAIECRTEGGRLPTGPGGTPEGLVALRLTVKSGHSSQFGVLTQQVANLRREVAKRRQAELLLRHQKGLLERMVGNHPVAEVLTAIARFIEDHSDGALCSILLMAEDGKHLTLGAAPSLPAAYNDAVDPLPIGPRVGSCGTAAFLKAPVIAKDIARDPLWADFKELAAEHDLAACWSKPVKGPVGEVLGTVAMYYRKPKAPSPSDLYLTSVGVDLTAIALLSERSRAALRMRAEQLAEADRRKDQFLAMLSHELRNPLAPIVNTLEILSSDPEASGMAAHVARLQRQTTHLSRLVDDLLDISRIAHGAVELKIERMDLRESLTQAVDSVSELIQSRRQTLRLPADGEPLWVDGDGDRLRQVFANLLTNAAKYTPLEGTIEAELSYAEGMAVARIRDTGQGLSREVRKSLFEPFSQGATSALDSRQGLGLGLTLVKQLVEVHGGVIEVASEGVGLGSEFTVRLPASAPADASDAQETRQSAAEGSPLEVLVVEDNLDSAEALATLLELWGHRSSVCHDGDAAVEMAMSSTPDVILLDLDLPGQNGYSVMRSLRQQGFSFDNRTIIAMTGFGRVQDIEKTSAAGFHHHLIKPVNPSALRKMLAEISAAVGT